MSNRPRFPVLAGANITNYFIGTYYMYEYNLHILVYLAIKNVFFLLRVRVDRSDILASWADKCPK